MYKSALIHLNQTQIAISLKWIQHDRNTLDVTQC